MSEPGGGEFDQNPNAQKIEAYQNPDYISLYRFENPNISYDPSREGSVSKESIVGMWFTNNLKHLKTYTRTRIKGEPGGRFAVVRIPKVDLEKYDATILTKTLEMDIELGNYIIPPTVGMNTRVEIEGIFKDEWRGKSNVPMTDWSVINDYIDANLTDEAIIEKITK